MIQKILDLASRVAQEAEVLEIDSEDTPVQYENNKLKSASTVATKGYALRIIKDGRIGFSSTTRQDAAEELVEHAVETAEFGQEVGFEFPSEPGPVSQVQIFDPEVANMSVEQLVENGRGVLDTIRQAEPGAQVMVWTQKSISRRRLANSRGLDVSYESTYYSVGAGIEIVQGTDMLQLWDGRDSRAGIDPSEFLADLIEKARIGKKIVPIESRTMPVLFTPKGFSDAFCLPLLLAFNGKEVLQGATPVSDKMGKQAMDPRISVYDDGTIDLKAGSRPFDDEGTAVRKLPLIENGVVSNFIYDLDTAAKAGASPTGHGRRDLGSLPSPSYNGIVFNPGEVPIEEMIRGVKSGLLVDQIMGAWSGNVRGGDFSGNVHYGIKIENGEMVGRVKDVMVSGNAFEALKNVEAIENKSRPLAGPLVAIPHLLFPSLSVSAGR